MQVEVKENNNTYCGIRLKDELFAINVMRINEVSLMLPLTKIPNCSPEIEGLINLRGEIVTVLNLKTIFYNEMTDIEDQMLVILENGKEKLGLIVDGVTDTFETSDEYEDKSIVSMFEDKSYLIESIISFDGKNIINLKCNEFFKII